MTSALNAAAADEHAECRSYQSPMFGPQSAADMFVSNSLTAWQEPHVNAQEAGGSQVQKGMVSITTPEQEPMLNPQLAKCYRLPGSLLGQTAGIECDGCRRMVC